MRRVEHRAAFAVGAARVCVDASRDHALKACPRSLIVQAVRHFIKSPKVAEHVTIP